MLIDIHAAGVTVVVPRKGGRGLLHGLVFDWEQGFLSPLTFEADFRRGNRTVFMAVTWPLYGMA